jgi:hypothetical protein
MISPSQTPLPDNTQHSQEKDFHAFGVIRTQNPNKQMPQTHALDGAASGIRQ